MKGLIEAWCAAARDLQITVHSPHRLMSPNGEQIQFEILVEDFGSRQGTLIFAPDDVKRIRAAQELGYFCSELNPKVYSTYNRELFIEMLNDWAYFGDKDSTPIWYSGPEISD
jgi:hypothetical protein